MECEELARANEGSESDGPLESNEPPEEASKSSFDCRELNGLPCVVFRSFLLDFESSPRLLEPIEEALRWFVVGACALCESWDLVSRRLSWATGTLSWGFKADVSVLWVSFLDLKS